MSWTRLDDGWTERSVFEGMPYSTRWHYLCLIQLCSRTDRVDGCLTMSAACRASDVPHPAEALAQLAAVGLVETRDGTCRLPFIGDHVPPPHVRNAADAAKVRMRRSRAHKTGDHSLCLPENCPDAPHVAGDVTRNVADPERVTRNPGTGRDRTGQAPKGSVTEVQPELLDHVTGEVLESDPWHLCRVCLQEINAELWAKEERTHVTCDPLGVIA